ncbi:tripartite motif-containing protein 66 [Pelodytes ibericus]
MGVVALAWLNTLGVVVMVLVLSVVLCTARRHKCMRNPSHIALPTCEMTCSVHIALFLHVIFLHLQSCYDCTEKNPAHSLCTHCNKWLCSTCAEQHRHSKGAGDHYLPGSQRASSGTDASCGNLLFCPIHSQETLRLFCETCDALMCRHCLLLEHKDHRFRRLDEALQNQRVLLENVITQVEEKKLGVQTAGKQIEDRLFEIKHMHRKVENQIKMTKMVIINELNKRINALLEQLEKITSEKQHKFEQQLQSVLVLNRQLEHVQNFINWAMYGKNSIPFLFSKELIVYQMQRLLETNCGSDCGRPLKLRFNWEPSYWSKQITNLGTIVTEGGQAPQTEVPSYGAVEDVQPSYYQSHHPASTPHAGAVTNSQTFPSTVHCPTPVCCTHCYTLPSVTKGQNTISGVNHHPPAFPHPTGIKQQSVQPMQYNKEQRCTSRPLRVIQPWLTHQPHAEHESSSYWSENQQKPQLPPAIQNVPPVCSVTTQDFGQVHTTLPLSTPSMQVPSVQMQLGPVHSVNHIQQQRHQQPALCQSEAAHEQVMHHSLDIINQQFELEQMQKGLELLLQSQPSNMQLNQSKQPQHVQQTIVGQINYIVRQPAAVSMQTPEEVPQVCDDSISPAHTVDLSPVTNSPGNMQSQSIADEIIAAVESDACRMNQFSANPVRKRSASVSFPNASDLELSSPRLSRSVDPQMPAVSCQFFGQPQDTEFSPDTETERMTRYSAEEGDVSEELHLGESDHLATSTAHLGNAICKVENEDFSCGNINTDLGNESSNTLSEFVLPLENMFEEPINLSIKKCVPTDTSVTAKKSRPVLQPVPIKQLKNEADESSSFQEPFAEDIKQNENLSRSEPKETKIPYVRLERLKICAPNSGELPVFKVQPQNKDEDGSLRLLIKYGAQSKSMSIKVNPESPYPNHHSPTASDIGPLPTSMCGSETLSQVSPQTPPRSLHQLPQQVKPFSRVSSFTVGAQESRIPMDLSIGSIGHTNDRTAEFKMNVGPPTMKKTSEDPNQIENEDFCAVCLNGGEMLCCDHCPKVFHLSCHVPALLSFPGGEWVCTLCRNLNKPDVEYDCDNIRYYRENLSEQGNLPSLEEYDQRKCEKLVLSLCCNNLSLPFQEPVSPLARHYFQIIKRPMDLSIIREKLQKRNVPHYATPEELAFDMRLMFWNCAKFNYPDSEVAIAGRKLEMFFENMLKESYPDKIFPLPQEEDSDSEEIDNESCPMNFKGFHWPSYGAECIQPKRRKRHTLSQKAKEFPLC